MAVEVTAVGAFPELFSEYVEYKRNLGYVYPNSRIYLVKRLSRFLAGRVADERVLTREAAEAFARPRDGESSGSAAGRSGIARQFALFLRWKGTDAWVLPEHAGPRRPSSFAPRIITADEMARVIEDIPGQLEELVPTALPGADVPGAVLKPASSVMVGATLEPGPTSAAATTSGPRRRLLFLPAPFSSTGRGGKRRAVIV